MQLLTAPFGIFHMFLSLRKRLALRKAAHLCAQLRYFNRSVKLTDNENRDHAHEHKIRRAFNAEHISKEKRDLTKHAHKHQAEREQEPKRRIGNGDFGLADFTQNQPERQQSPNEQGRRKQQAHFFLLNHCTSKIEMLIRSMYVTDFVKFK